jgi:hypothetical protein
MVTYARQSVQQLLQLACMPLVYDDHMVGSHMLAAAGCGNSKTLWSTHLQVACIGTQSGVQRMLDCAGSASVVTAAGMLHA